MTGSNSRIAISGPASQSQGRKEEKEKITKACSTKSIIIAHMCMCFACAFVAGQ
jgi:hypothetical protein